MTNQQAREIGLVKIMDGAYHIAGLETERIYRNGSQGWFITRGANETFKTLREAAEALKLHLEFAGYSPELWS